MRGGEYSAEEPECDVGECGKCDIESGRRVLQAQDAQNKVQLSLRITQSGGHEILIW